MRFHEVVHGIYFDDLDAFKILHNARYVLLFERTIGSFWEQMGSPGPLGAMSDPDQYHLVRSNHVEYLRAVHGEVGKVRVRVFVEKLGTTSMTFGLKMLPMDEDVDYAVGTRTVVKVNSETRRPEPWTDALRTRLQPYIQTP